MAQVVMMVSCGGMTKTRKLSRRQFEETVCGLVFFTLADVREKLRRRQVDGNPVRSHRQSIGWNGTYSSTRSDLIRGAITNAPFRSHPETDKIIGVLGPDEDSH